MSLFQSTKVTWSDIKKCEYCNNTTTIKDDGFFICDSCYKEENTVTCEYCNTTDYAGQYNNIFSNNGILICQECYEKKMYKKDKIKCEYCYSTNSVAQYTTIFSYEGIMLCDKCYSYEDDALVKDVEVF
jgi:hypothetical protein